ncbi:hypothetical protein D3C72_1497570 [compost metagenome]
MQPEVIQALANQRPAGDRLMRWRNMNAFALDDGDRILHRVDHGGAQQVGWQRNDGDGGQHDQRGGAAVLVAQPAPEPDLERVDGHRQDHGPDNEIEEGAEYPEAEDCQHRDQPGTDQHIE